MITQAAQAAQAWEEGMPVELKRQEEIYLIEQEQERNTVQARGWEWDSFRDEANIRREGKYTTPGFL